MAESKPEMSTTSTSDKCKLIVVSKKSAFDGCLVNIIIMPTTEQHDLNRFLSVFDDWIAIELKKALALHRGIKAWVKVDATYHRLWEMKTFSLVLKTVPITLRHEWEIQEAIGKFNVEIIRASEEWDFGFSNLVFGQVVSACLSLCQI